MGIRRKIAKKRTFFLVIFEGVSGGFVLESWFFVLVKLSD